MTQTARPGRPLLREFIRDQLPLIAGVFLLGVALSHLQHGLLAGGERAFSVAGIRVAVWHLVLMGFLTGYAMGLVGEASGIFSLPYCVSVLQFTNLAVSPTSLVTTFFNPFGALLGFYRNRQWNLDLALWPCLGAALGSPLGPLIRVFLLNDPEPFKAVAGLCLILMAGHLVVQVTPWYLGKTERLRAFKEKFDRMIAARLQAGQAPSGLPEDFRIATLHRSLKTITIGYWGETRTFSVPLLLAIGWGVGVVAATLGVGGGFLLVPILASLFGLPLYVLVAATIPFVITLSLTGLLAYTLTLPFLTGRSVQPDWSFGLFVASGAILGSWLAAKTQRFVPERFLKPMLATITGLVGLLYVVGYFWPLPFKI